MQISDFRKLGRQATTALLGVALGVLCLPSRADTFNYSGTHRQIKACVLVSSAAQNTFGSNTGPDNVTPHLFYVLDARTDTKPAGWEFTNPLAPGTITGTIYNRWKQRIGTGGADPAFQSGTAASVIFQVGAPLTKNIGAYWEVNLDNVTDSSLKQFDIVFMAIKNLANFQLSTTERELLRHYVDGGGTVWFECEGTGGNTNQANEFFVNTQFNPVSTAGLPVLASNFHPLVNYPFGISPVEAQRLGLGTANNGGWSTLAQVSKPQVGLDPTVMVPVVYNGGAGALTPLVSAGTLGAGHVIISGAGIAGDVNNYIGGSNAGPGLNSAAVSGNNLLAVPGTDLKFAYNVISWLSSVPTANVNARRTGSTQETIGSNLGLKWATVPLALQNPAVSAPGPGSGVAIHKRVAYVATGDNVLHAYDTFPDEDLDGDLNSDDGIPDHNSGAPYDEIWNYPLPSAPVRVSTPTVAAVADSSGNPVDILTLTDSTGTTYGFTALPTANGRISGKANLLWKSKYSGDLSGSLIIKGQPVPAPSPAFSEGVLFTLAYSTNTQDSTRPWFVQPLDPATGNNLFATNANESVGYAPTPRSTMTGLPPVIGDLAVGYVRDAGSNAIDKIVYVPTRPVTTSGVNTTGTSDTLVGLWFSTRGEPMIPADTSTTAHTLYTVGSGERRYVPWWAPPTGGLGTTLDSRVAPTLHVVYANGNTVDLHYGTDFTVGYQQTQLTGITGPARLGNSHYVTVTITAALNPSLTDNDHVYADYTVDWPGGPVGDSGTAPLDTELEYVFNNRSATVYNDNNTGGASDYHLIGPPAISPDDRIFFLVDDEPTSSSASQTVFPTRVYCLHDQFVTSTTAQVNPTGQSATQTPWAWWPNDSAPTGTSSVTPRLTNSDSWVPNGVSSSSGVPITGFQAIGSPVVSNGVTYVVGQSAYNGNSNNRVAVVVALNSNPTNTFTIPLDEATLQTLNTTGVYQNITLYQYDISKATTDANQTISMTGTTTGSPNFTATVTQNATNTAGTLQITITDFHTASGDFNSALPIYYSIGGGGGAANAQGPAPLTNAAGFGILDNVLWYMVIPTEYTAQVINTAPILSGIPTSGPTVHGSVLYFCSDLGEVTGIDLPTDSGGAQALVYNGTSLRVHRQSTLTNTGGSSVGKSLVQTNMIYPPLGTTNTLLVPTPQGVAALDNQITVISDANRLLAVNHAGDAVWEIGGTQTVGIAGGSINNGTGSFTSTKIPLSRPGVAIQTGPSSFLVADTGNNRIVELDRGGFATMELASFHNDMLFLRPNDSLTLNQPTDVQTFTQSGTGISLNNHDTGNPNDKTGVTYSYSGAYYAVHYLIADSGNYRALEIVDVYQPNGQPVVMTGTNGTTVTMLHQAVFVTRSYSEQNLHLRYRTIQQFYDPTDTTRINAGQLPIYLIAAVDNVRQAGTDPGTITTGLNNSNAEGPGGSLMVITRDYNYSGSPANKDGDVATIINSIALPNDSRNINSGVLAHQQLSNPTWFKKFDVADPTTGSTVPRYLLADDNGVYVLAPVVTGGVSEAMVEWQLTSKDYYRMTGRRLKATSVVRLSAADYDSGTNRFYPHYLITNSYSGKDNVPDLFMSNLDPTGTNPAAYQLYRGDINGEVFEVRGMDYYLTSTPQNDGYFANSGTWLYTTNVAGTAITKNAASAIVWMCPNETLPTNTGGNPVAGKIIRSIGTSAPAGTYLLSQPTFSDRPY